MNRSSVKDNTSPGEETIVVSLLRYSGVVPYILRRCRYVSGGVNGSVMASDAKQFLFSWVAGRNPEIAFPRNAGLRASQNDNFGLSLQLRGPVCS
jgi:hypothetical protein